LARLLGGDALRELHLFDRDGEQLLDAPAATLLANALRANSTLTFLALDAVNLWRDPTAAELLLQGATAHPSLRKLDLQGNTVDEASRARAGRALGALLAANAPSLEELNIVECSLGDAGLGPLVDALASNTHLHTLRCFGNAWSDAFMHERLLPATRSNPSLSWVLEDSEDEDDWEDDDEGEESDSDDA
jgi:Ran GTPase-activating protein (RanGAP) involved in mRNA processing and transport